MRKVITKGKKGHPHAQDLKASHRLTHIGADHSQILGNHREQRITAEKASQKIGGRGRHPFTRYGRGLVGGYFPEGHQASKMVDPDPVKVSQVVPDALQPPVVSGGLQPIPAVDRMAPQLTGGAEIVRRDAGNTPGKQLIVQFEQIGMGPDVGAAMVDIDGDVAEQLNLIVFAILAQRPPLLVKQKLQELFLE